MESRSPSGSSTLGTKPYETRETPPHLPSYTRLERESETASSSSDSKTSENSLTVLEEAENLVNGPRRRDYDHPKHNFAAIARAWSDIVGYPITPRKTALMMIALKVIRDAHRPKRDNVVDVCGYARCIELLDED